MNQAEINGASVTAILDVINNSISEINSSVKKNYETYLSQAADVWKSPTAKSFFDGLQTYVNEDIAGIIKTLNSVGNSLVASAKTGLSHHGSTYSGSYTDGVPSTLALTFEEGVGGDREHVIYNSERITSFLRLFKVTTRDLARCAQDVSAAITQHPDAFSDNLGGSELRNSITVICNDITKNGEELTNYLNQHVSTQDEMEAAAENVIKSNFTIQG